MSASVIEIIGYAGSALVLVSMLMVSVVRLRIINLAGSVIFAAYAVMIRSWPTAVMNVCLAGVNIFHLVRIFREQKHYDLIRLSPEDGYFSYLLVHCAEDIAHWFPEFCRDPEGWLRIRSVDRKRRDGKRRRRAEGRRRIHLPSHS